MAEIVPLAGGLIVGGIVGYSVPGWYRRLSLIIAAAVVIGVFASSVSGELLESPVFLAIDIPGSLFAAMVGAFAVDRLETWVSARRPLDR